MGRILSLLLFVTHFSILCNMQALYSNRAEGFNVLVVLVHLQYFRWEESERMFWWFDWLSSVIDPKNDSNFLYWWCDDIINICNLSLSIYWYLLGCTPGYGICLYYLWKLNFWFELVLVNQPGFEPGSPGQSGYVNHWVTLHWQNW